MTAVSGDTAFAASSVSEPLSELPAIFVSGETVSGSVRSASGSDDTPLLTNRFYASRGDNLQSADAYIYDAMKKNIIGAAAGEAASSAFSISATDYLSNTYGKTVFTASDLGVDTIVKDKAVTDEAKAAATALLSFRYEPVLYSLLNDMPYELYWFDKVAGYTVTMPSYKALYNETRGAYVLDFSASNYTFALKIAAAYSLTGDSDTTDFNTEKTAAAGGSLATARAIVDAASELSDYEKLNAYRAAILDLVSYNFEAAGAEDVSYDDAFQLLYVFDGDPETNVVCEGYAKAFKYLCDLSQFSDSKIECVLVSGTVGDEAHIWNLVTMKNGKHYLCDLTNSDEGAIGENGGLFLVGSRDSFYENDILAGYQIVVGDQTLTYTYDASTQNTFSEDELTLAPSDYDDAVDGSDTNNAVQTLTTPKITKIIVKNGKATLSWKKDANVSGYQIRYSYTSQSGTAVTKTVTVRDATAAKKTLGNLKAGRTYQFSIRSYLATDDTTYRSAWSATKKIKIK